MAVLLKADGSLKSVMPENGKDFKLKELYKLLDVNMIEIIHLDKRQILVCDENGKLHDEPMLNKVATYAYQRAHGPIDEIYGNALFCLHDEVR